MTVVTVFLTAGWYQNNRHDCHIPSRTVTERFERIVEQMKQAHGITERLKAENQMEWVARMNNLQSCAREIVDKEMIYQ